MNAPKTATFKIRENDLEELKKMALEEDRTILAVMSRLINKEKKLKDKKND
jgi:hypothetical protein